jgi:hypothetical protein
MTVASRPVDGTATVQHGSWFHAIMIGPSGGLYAGETVTEISRNVVHTVSFFQTAFTIILALALGEALKQFVSDGEEHPVHWDKLPSFLSFLLIIFPFFQGMGQFMFETYLNPATALKSPEGFLMFDGVAFLLESAIFFVMSRSLSAKHWRRYYGAVLLLLFADSIWAGVTYLRGIHVGFWLVLNAILAAVLLAVLWWEDRTRETLRPSIICAATVSLTTMASYIEMNSFYFS